MRIDRTIVSALATGLFLLPSAANAQSPLETVTGRILTGKISKVDATAVTIEVDGVQERLARANFKPHSFYAAFAAHAAVDTAEDRLKLAAVAEELGLSQHAIAQLRVAAKLEPKRRQLIDRRIEKIREALAADVLMEGKAALAEHDLALAKRSAEVVLSRYPKTEAALEATQLYAKAAGDMPTQGKVEPLDAKALKGRIDRAHRLEMLVDRQDILVRGGIRYTAKDRRVRERAIQYLERAWRSTERVGPDASVPDEVAVSFLRIRERLRSKLTAHYLALGSLFVQRFALPMAEELNAKACRLDPTGKACADLQRLIIEARLNSGTGF